MIQYSTFYGSFSGDTPEEIVEQLYEDSRRGIGPVLTRQKWWEYQRTVWKLREGKELSASLDEPGAAAAFVACMVEVGALEVGTGP